MRHWHRMMVAMTALIALTLSLGVGMTLWRAWRHPARARVAATQRGARWSALGCAWRLWTRDGRLERLLIEPLEAGEG